MKKTLLISTFATLAILTNSFGNGISSITLSNFGTSVEGSEWTYNNATSTVSGNEDVGALLFNPNFSSSNFTTLSNFSPTNLQINLTGFVTIAPPGSFGITFESPGLSGNGATVSTPISWSLFSTTSSTVSVLINTESPNFTDMDWTDIAGWSLDSGGSGNSVNATFTQLSVSVIPEPSTYALMALGGLVLFYIARRRKAQQV
jgi:hypothetical protein